MGKVQHILDLIDEIRKTDQDLMVEAPRKTWRSILDLDDSLDMLRYRAERLYDELVEATMDN